MPYFCRLVKPVFNVWCRRALRPVYGESEELPKTEAMRVQPMSPYGLHKLIGEQYSMLFNRLYGLETVSLRIL